MPFILSESVSVVILFQGGYHSRHIYTQDQIAEIIEFARILGIRVVPEFDSLGTRNNQKIIYMYHIKVPVELLSIVKFLHRKTVYF